VDTFSGFLVATTHTEEKAREVKLHWLRHFATMGVPKTIKTDNGPAYVSRTISVFLQDWSIQHVTGIPHSSTAQAIVESAHGTLKAMLNKQKRGNPMSSVTPQDQLDKALYVLNFLNCSDDQLFTIAADHQFGMVPPFVVRPKVWYKKFEESQWTGPVELIMWGRRYACVLLSTCPRWLPAKYVKPYHELKECNAESNARGDHAHSQGATSDVEAEEIHSG